MAKHNFGYFIHEGVSNMFSHGFMSFAAIGITVACLLIMGTFTLVAVNANAMLAELDECIPAKETTEEQVEARELTRLLERWLDSLPQEDRVLFVRRYWYGEPAGKHVKRLWRLRQKLKAYLEQEGVPL